MISLLVLLALGPAAAPATIVDRDPDARDVQSVGQTLTWLRAQRLGEEFDVTLRFRRNGQIGTAPGLPGRYSAFVPEAYGDLGLDRRGRIVQVVGDSLGFLWVSGEPSSQQEFWAYSVRTRQAQPVALPAVGPGCVVERMAMWLQRTVAAANCGGDGVIFVDDGGAPMRAMTIAGIDRFAAVTAELDAAEDGRGVSLAFTRCDEPATPGEGCSSTTGGADRHDAWLLRDRCAPRLLARTTRRSRALDTPHVDGPRVYWLESRDGVASLRSRTLRRRCRVGRAKLARRIGRWERHVSATVAGSHVYVARDGKGVRRSSL